MLTACWTSLCAAGASRCVALCGCLRPAACGKQPRRHALPYQSASACVHAASPSPNKRMPPCTPSCPLQAFDHDRAKTDRQSTSRLSPHIHYGARCCTRLCLLRSLLGAQRGRLGGLFGSTTARGALPPLGQLPTPALLSSLCRRDQCAPHLLRGQARGAGVGQGRRRRHQRGRLPAPAGLPRVRAAAVCCSCSCSCCSSRLLWLLLMTQWGLCGVCYSCICVSRDCLLVVHGPCTMHSHPASSAVKNSAEHILTPLVRGGTPPLNATNAERR